MSQHADCASSQPSFGGYSCQATDMLPYRQNQRCSVLIPGKVCWGSLTQNSWPQSWGPVFLGHGGFPALRLRACLS